MCPAGWLTTVTRYADRTQAQPFVHRRRLFLTPGESVRVESGAMIAHSGGVDLAARSEGG